MQCHLVIAGNFASHPTPLHPPHPPPLTLLPLNLSLSPSLSRPALLRSWWVVLSAPSDPLTYAAALLLSEVGLVWWAGPCGSTPSGSSSYPSLCEIFRACWVCSPSKGLSQSSSSPLLEKAMPLQRNMEGGRGEEMEQTLKADFHDTYTSATDETPTG